MLNRLIAPPPILIPKNATVSQRERLRFPIIPNPNRSALHGRLFGGKHSGSTVKNPAVGKGISL